MLRLTGGKNTCMSFTLLSKPHPLSLQGRHNKTWPSWVSQEMVAEMRDEIIPVSQLEEFCGPRITRLTGGRALNG